jgi:serine/threonine protein phosphatase PrpC
MKYEIIKKSIIGKRPEQQDAVDYFRANGFLFAVVCDGMGGMKGGSVASQTALACFKELTMNAENLSEDLPEFFLRSIDIMDEAVFRIEDEAGDKMNSGTTFVALAIKDRSAFWLSVGDSRLYILRDGEILQVTRDHNYLFTLNQMLSAGVISKTEYEEQLFRGDRLTSYLGMGGIEFMDICQAPFALKSGDYLIITSDGLYKTLSDEEIQDIIIDAQSVRAAAERMVDSVLERDRICQDNTSFALIKVMED